MRKSRFSEDQMVKILREADKHPVAEVAKKHGISEQTLYVWRKRYGQLDSADGLTSGLERIHRTLAFFLQPGAVFGQESMKALFSP